MSRIANAAREGRLIVFAGAGVSMIPPTALPSWRDVNTIVIDALSDAAATLLGRELSVQAREILLQRHTNERLPPEYQAEILADVLGDRYFEVLRHLDSDRPNAAHLAIALLARFGAVRTVLTTNFDTALEQAFELGATPFEVLYCADQFAEWAGRGPGFDRQQSGCLILKIHGSAVRPDSLVDTLAQRKRGLPTALLTLTRELLHSGHWAFLGFSGLDLEAEPRYLGLAAEAKTAVGFTWLVRPGTGRRGVVEELAAEYGERAEIVAGELPEWLFEIADRLVPNLRSEVAALAARVSQPPEDPLAVLRGGAAQWAAKISGEASAIALTRLVAAAAEPQLAMAMWRTLRSAPSDAILLIGEVPVALAEVASHSLGCLLGEAGQHAEAVDHLTHVFERLQATGDERARELLDRIRRNLGCNLRTLGRTDEAERYLESALAGAGERSDAGQVASILTELANLRIDAGRYAEARSLAEKALDAAVLAGDENGRIMAMNQLGIVAQRLDELPRALEVYEECAHLCTRLGADANAATARGNCADVLALMGRLDEAETLQREVLAELTRLGRQSARAESLISLGWLASRRGESDEAERCYDEARAILAEIGDPLGEAKACSKLAALRANQGRFEDALELDHAALALLGESADEATGYALAHAGLCQLKLGLLVQARESYARSCEIAQGIDDTFLLASASHNLGTLHLLARENEDAVRKFTAVTDLWRRIGRAEGAAMAQLGAAAAHLDQTLAALSQAGHTGTDRAQQGEAAHTMTQLYPALISLYRQLGAAELAAHCALSAATTYDFLRDERAAAEWFADAARSYAGVGLVQQRDQAYEKLQRGLAARVQTAIDTGDIDAAIAVLSQLAELAHDIDHEHAYQVARLNIASVLTHFTPRHAEARAIAMGVRALVADDSTLFAVAGDLLARLDGASAAP